MANNINLKTDTAALGDGVDFAAAGVKDLNNFKGYHNQEQNKKDEAERYIDPVHGAHFKFNDISQRILNIAKNKLQEKKVFTLTGRKEQLDETYYIAIKPIQIKNINQ